MHSDIFYSFFFFFSNFWLQSIKAFSQTMKQTWLGPWKTLIHATMPPFLTRWYQSRQIQMDSIFTIFNYWASHTWNPNNSQTIPWNVFKNADSDSVALRWSWDFAFLTSPLGDSEAKLDDGYLRHLLHWSNYSYHRDHFFPSCLFFLSPSLFSPSFHKCVWRINRLKKKIKLCLLPAGELE